jgi:hypothetical protein
VRALAIAAAALALAGCAQRPETSGDTGKKTSYNRRELPESPGLFTGRDGSWTIYRSDGPPPPPEPPPPPRRTILLEEPDPPAEDR